MEEQRAEVSHKKKSPITGIIVVVLFFAGVVALYSWISGYKSPESTVFESKISGNKAIDPSTLSVEISVTNKGATPKKPSCAINVENASGDYSGYDVLNGEQIDAGDTKTFVKNISISKEGAPYITSGHVSCR